MVNADVISALQLCKRVEPTTELVIHATKQGSYLFSIVVKGRTRLKEKNALETCEKLCSIAGVKPFKTSARFPPTMPIFFALHVDRLSQFGLQRVRYSND